MSDSQPKSSIISPQRRQLLKLGVLTGASGAVAIASKELSHKFLKANPQEQTTWVLSRFPKMS